MHLLTLILPVTYLIIGGAPWGRSAAASDIIAGDVCECTPECGIIDEIGCISGLFVPREDCPCCDVCVRLEGDSCSLGGGTTTATAPCDKRAELTCSSKGICQAMTDCEFDSHCPDDLSCVKSVCVDPCPLLEKPCSEVLMNGICVTMDHQTKCQCPLGSSLVGEKCSPTQRLGGKSEKSHNEVATTKPDFLLIKSVTQNSTVIIVPSVDGGILHYKDSRSDTDASKMSVAKGKHEVIVNGLKPSTKYIFKWVGNDGSSGKLETKTDDGCMYNDVSYPVGAKWHLGCQETFSCHIGGKSERRQRCIFTKGSIEKDGCEELPSSFDPECCVEYNCNKQQNSVLESSSLSTEGLRNSILAEPKLIVTSRTHNSVTVAWDDFRADDPSSSYVTEYREKISDVSIAIPWMKRETPRGQPPPTMTIANLKPNTNYEVRVGIYSNSKDRKLTAATQKIEVKTEPGCVYGNTSFPVGEFFQGCDERCLCALDSSVKCSERCSIPYFRRNSFANDPLCTEKPADEDDCCVRVMCDHGEGLSGLEGDYDQCANIVCGPNTECVSWPTLIEVSSGTQESPQPGSCRCLRGFSGNPTDLETGCVSDPKMKEESSSCKFNSMLYSPGEVFFDGCSYRCTCNDHLETYCQPRCKYSITEKKDPSCDYHLDPNDECCQVRKCDNSTVFSGLDAMESPPLTFEGCIYKNKTYSKDEQFSDGCDSKCSCMGRGDVSCYPRCPPTKEITETPRDRICETLVDPQDECCNVTICDSVVPEVMKTGISANLLESVDRQDDTNETTTALMEEGKSEETTTLAEISHTMDENITEVIVEQTTHKLLSAPTAAPLKRFRFDDSLLTPLEIIDITPIDSSTVKFKVRVDQEIITNILSSSSEYLTVSYSQDSQNWMNKTVYVDNIDVFDMHDLMFTVPDLEAFDAYTFRVTYDGASSPVKRASLLSSQDSLVISAPIVNDDSCQYNDKIYKTGETFYEDCRQFCVCDEDRTVHCSVIKCPKDFGLNVLDPGCMEWEDDSEYIAMPPKCCGFKPTCTLHMDDLACHHQGQNFSHYEYIPKEMVGCDQRCQCLGGRLDCFDICVPLSATPPFSLNCPPNQIRLVSKSSFPCCKEWQCVTSAGPDSSHHLVTLPAGLHNIVFPEPAVPPPGISTPIIENLTENSVTFTFTIPNTFVGLPGGLYLRYTDNVLLNWESEVIHEDGVTLDRSKWQYKKTGLQPGTEYSMQLALSSHLTKAEVISPHFTVTTKIGDLGEQIMEISRHLSVDDITKSSAVISWKVFTKEQIKYMHGIKVRYWSTNIEIPKKSPLQHVDTSGITLRDLSPNMEYTVDLVIVPQPNSPFEITFNGSVTFTTLPDEPKTDLPDREKLDLDAELTISDIGMTSAKISWRDFTEIELRYIDGFGIRTWSNNKRFPEVGPMLHSDADNMILKSLSPDTNYTVDLFFIAHSGLTTTISNIRNATFTTQPKMKDKYEFDISIRAGETGAKQVQILYSGVPRPEGNYVHVFRVVYTSDEDHQDSQKFQVPKNQENGVILLTDLRPKVKYEVWLEAYIKDGSRKKSNVINVMSADDSDSPAINEIESKELKQDEDGNYYSAFVAVAILVAIACLIIIGLLFVLMRRTNHAKADINSSETNASYNNPSYRPSENPNYAMEMNGMKNNTNNMAEEP